MKIQCQMCDIINVIKVDGRKVFKGQGEFQFTCLHCGKEIYVVVSIS